jgi:hypothetical protein
LTILELSRSSRGTVVPNAEPLEWLIVWADAPGAAPNGSACTALHMTLLKLP